MKYDTIIFDLDGTLINSLEDLCDSVNTVLLKHELPERSLEEVKSFVGNGVGMLMKRALPEGIDEKQYNLLLDEFKTHYKTHMQVKTKPYEGINILLTKLKEKGFQTAIVSNKFEQAAKEISECYFGSLIDIAIGESAQIKKKPSPDGINAALAYLHSSKEKAIYIGDSETDIETAINSCLTCIGVTWGFRSCETLKNAGATNIVNTPEELFYTIINLAL